MSNSRLSLVHGGLDKITSNIKFLYIELWEPVGTIAFKMSVGLEPTTTRVLLYLPRLR